MYREVKIRVHLFRPIMFQFLSGIAMRKKGITEADYLSPLTVDDGRK